MNLRKWSALLGAVALTFSVATVAFAEDAAQVTICHATDSNTNPYVNPTVNISSSGHLQGGHDTEHLGPLWTPTSKADKIEWGDIIPPYTYNGFVYEGHNWTTAGQAIWANGCVVPGEESNPAIHVVKTSSVSTLPAGGGSVTYTYVVTNTGDVALSNVSVSDDKCSPVTYVSGDTGSDALLAVDETWTYSCTTTLTATTTNIATATGHRGAVTVTDTDSITVTVTPSAPAIHVEKSASTTTLPFGGGAVTYTYTVTNAGNIALTNVSVSDDKCSPVTYVSGDTGSANVLGLTETWIYTCSATLTGTTTNVGTATGHDGQTEVTDTDNETVTVAPPGPNPAIHIEKTVSPTTLPVGGGDVTYTFVVSNTGNVPVFDVNVRDDNGTPTPTTDDFNVVCPKTELAVAESMTCTALVSGTVETTTNTATVTANWDDCNDGCSEAVPPDSDSAIVTVTLGGGVQGETDTPTAPPTDAIATTTTDAGGSLPILLIVLGIIGLGAVLLTPVRARR